MALFKILRGSSTGLKDLPITDGWCYFTPDTGLFYIDYNGTRVPLNAKDAQTLSGASLVQALNGEGLDQEILSAAAVNEIKNNLELLIAAKQERITGTEGQAVVIGANGSPTVVNTSLFTSGGIINQNTGEIIKIWRGTKAEYNALETKSDDVMYIITDDDSLVDLDKSALLKSVEVNLPSSGAWRSVIYGNNRFVAVADISNIAAYSDDGINWTQTTLPDSKYWSSVTFGNNRFVAVADESNIAAYSDDGITWNQTILPSTVNWKSVTFGNGRFVAVADNSNIAAYSDDGINWTQTTLPSSAYWRSIAYGNSLFVSLAYGSNIAAYSDDGINWTQTTLPASKEWYSVTYGNGCFVAVADSSNIAAYSSDGITWDQVTLPVSKQWSSVTYGNGRFVVVAAYSNIAAYSDDGINWTQTTLPVSKSWQSVTFGNGRFVVIVFGATIVAYSDDGIIWHNTADVLTYPDNTDIKDRLKSALDIDQSVSIEEKETWNNKADALFKPEGKSYLTFSSPNSFTLAINDATKHWDGTLEYFAEDKTWTVWDGTTTLSSVNNDGEYVLYLRGTGNTVIIGESSVGWVLRGSNIACMGNIENLLDYATVESGNHPTMADSCYIDMFRDCTALTQAPALPATTLTTGCYQNMFYGCTKLTKAPTLPATTLAVGCYYQMFNGCTSLIQAPALPAITMAYKCYGYMFNGCTALTQAPVLPATTLAPYCYRTMFQDCTALTQAPALPATTLAEGCYSDMFRDCTALTQAPALPATTLVEWCYFRMFQGCTSLKLSSTKTGEYTQEYRIPSSGTGTTATNALTDMFASTGGTFTGTPEINTTYYLSSDNMVVHNTKIATLREYISSMIDTTSSDVSSGVKIQTGSYVGTGTHGSSNPCSLTFDFEPKVIFIYCMSGNRNPQDSDAIMFLEDFNETFTQGSNSYSMAIHLVATTAGSPGGLYGQAGYIYGKKNNNTVSWYSDTNSQLQINYKGKIYRYLAIG